MKAIFGVVLLGSVTVATPTRAAFQMVSSNASQEAGDQPASELVNRAPQSPVSARRRTGPVGVPIAQGFGKQVPLSFAARQIVPAKVRVTFGPGIDPAAVVDWTGGRAWNETLRAAVQPLGLRVIVGWMTVAITRG